ncbi:tetratricopeptide repeat protein [Halocynthiibacter styelae]|uniref:Sel1 repeat family protein n=1 Tax=Halocynthiibacter styelae TaxID=2761955 RepID=A0A8J7IRH7_9RHOB|nr:tetratricopeptide repeat protein [Paenihalocynthiibacter styelae]MBI1495556.1 sel1 repeat family protein [Paenihalocynthiibacter styelae]
MEENNKNNDRSPFKLLHIVMIALFVSSTGSDLLAQDFNTGEAFYSTGDYANAMEEWRPLAEQGDMRAQFFLGEMYAFGLGLSKNRSEAMRWFLLAAEQGHPDAQYNVGRLYDEESDWSTGETFVEFLSRGGIIEDPTEAARWYRLAAQQGHAIAQFLLGLKYAKGDGVLKDPEEAELWLRRGAEQGDMQLQRNLGWMYANGEGIIQDTSEAMIWYRLAAQQGHPDAQNSLGQMYTNRDSTIKAHMWFNISSSTGHSDAAENRDEIENIMTREQITEATQLAQTCIRSNYTKCD